MAKKASKKQYWGWVKADTPGKPSEVEKQKVAATFDPWVQQQKNELPPVKEPQEFNQVVDIYTRWKGSNFYLMGYYKCPDKPEYIAKGFETGVARLTYKRTDCYDLSYYRHTGKWFAIMFDLTLEQAFEEVTTNPSFAIY